MSIGTLQDSWLQEIGVLTSVEWRHFPIVFGPEIIALVLSVLWCRSVFLVGVFGVHGEVSQSCGNRNWLRCGASEGFVTSDCKGLWASRDE